MTAYPDDAQEPTEQRPWNQGEGPSLYTKVAVVAAGLLFVLFLSTRGRSSETQGATQVVTPRTMTEFRNLTEGKDAKPSLLKFYANWCGPCRVFAPTFDRASETKSLDVNYLAINIDNLGEIGQKYGVSSIPAVVAIDARGREKARMVGVLRPEDIKKLEESVAP